MHKLLSDIYVATDLKKVLNKAILNGIVADHERIFYETRLKKLLHHPEIHPYFTNAYQIYTEREILVNQEFKRLDRLCISEDSATIIDYKTGKLEPSHKIQIETYAAAIAEMGFRIAKKLLIYLEEENIKIEYVP